MNKTANFQLTQWEKTDRILMEEFNSDNEKIDTALKSNADKAAALQTALAGAGNCEIGLFTYTGTGSYGSKNPTVISFPKMPTVFIIKGSQGIMLARGGESKGTTVVQIGSSSLVQDLSLAWQGNKFSFYHTNSAQQQMNAAGTYWVLTFYKTK